MSNAWEYYVGPLGVSLAFVSVGVVSLGFFVWGGRNADGTRRAGLIAIFSAVFGLAVGGAVAIPFLLTSPTPRERQRIYDHVFRTPPERIDRFIIKAGTADQATPLTPTEVVIEDPARVRRIAEILRTAAETEVSPNHPRTRWYAVVEMVTRDGTYHFSVSATEPGDRNGTLVGPWAEGSRWNLGSVRADGLDEILEDAVKKARKPN